MSNTNSMVNHPPHYGGDDDPYETIKVIEAWGPRPWGMDFCLGNAIKYISRAGKKGDMVEDLKKAVWYINRRIKQIEDGKNKDVLKNPL